MQTKTIFLAIIIGCIVLLSTHSRYSLAAKRYNRSVVKAQTSQAATNQDADLAQAVSGNNSFSFALLKRIYEPGKNLLLSPFSVRTAMAMMSAGAKEDTLKQLHTGIDLRLNGEQLHRAMGRLSASLSTNAGSAYDLAIVNSLWNDVGNTLLPDFVTTVQGSYAADVEEVNFRQNADAARKKINEWVGEKTQFLIRDLIPPGAVDAKTLMVLVNAVYFKGKWQTTFDSNATSKGPFRSTSAKPVAVKFMEMTTKSALVAEAADVTLLRLPYEGERMVMDILLPNDVNGLDAQLQDLTLERLDAMAEELSPRAVNIRLPRFSLRWGTQNILPSLQAMGMDKVFGAGANFSGIGKSNPSIGAVFHQVLVEVTEEGTKAAAATAVLTVRGFSPPSKRPLEFHADHPFVFFIRDLHTNTIIFVGVVVDPT